MAVKCVFLSADVYLVCLNHSLTTEKEEVMGLLIGEIDEKRVSHISAVIMLCRSDKRRDRVEISPEQLSDASTKAELNRIQVTCFQSVNQSPEAELPQYIRIEIPLHIVPTAQISYTCLESLVNLPSVLRQEEQIAFDKTGSEANEDHLMKLHNSAVYTKSLCNVTEVTSIPLVNILESRLETNSHKIQCLLDRKLALLAKQKRIKERN